MKKRTALITAAVAGLVAAGGIAQVDTALANDGQNHEKNQNGCHGPNGCSGKKAKAADADHKDKHKSKGQHGKHEGEGATEEKTD